MVQYAHGERHINRILVEWKRRSVVVAVVDIGIGGRGAFESALRNVDSVKLSKAMGEEPVGISDAAPDIEGSHGLRPADQTVDGVEELARLDFREVVEIVRDEGDRTLDVFAIRIRVRIEVGTFAWP
jgi:hypothetical protein